MRRWYVAIILVVCAALGASAQSPPTAPSLPDAPGLASAQQKTAYFVIDASSSMKGFQDTADQEAEKRLAEYGANPPAAASYTYFHGCRSNVVISDPGSKPARPDAGGGTPLGAALVAALARAKDGPADIFIVTDAVQTDSCGPDICVVARDLLPKPNIEVTLIPLNASRQNQDRLACIEGAQFGSALMLDQKAITVAPAEVKPAAPAKPADAAGKSDRSPAVQRGRPLPFFESLPCVALIGLFASSFFLFGNTFGQSARQIEAKFKTLQADMETGDAKIARPQFRIATALFSGAATASLALLWVPWDGLDFARAAANDTLNTQFGASVFLAALLMLAGFAGSQYWRYIELRRSYSVATNEAERDKKAKADEAERLKRAKDEEATRLRQEKLEAEVQRLHAYYLRQRGSLLDRDYRLERYLEAGDKQEENVRLLQGVVDAVKFLALGPELPRDQVSTNEINRISLYNDLFTDRSFRGLVTTLSGGRLPQSIVAAITDFLYPEQRRNADAQNETLKAILASVDPFLAKSGATP